MSDLHKQIIQRGQMELNLDAADREAKRRVDAAARILTEETERRVFSHPGLCLTILPHRRRPDHEVWRRENGPVKLTVQPVADEDGVYSGVPYGAKARLILLYLQTEAARTDSRRVALGRSMRDWMRNMGVKIGGTNLKEIRLQSHRIERSLLTMTYQDTRGTVRWQDTIVRGSFEARDPADDDHLTVELSESFFAAIKRHPVPVSERALRILGERCTAIDVYMWLSYRLHALDGPTFVPWEQLFAQFGAGTRALKHFKPRFVRDFELALAVYPDARVKLSEEGVLLQPSPPPVSRTPSRPRLVSG